MSRTEQNREATLWLATVVPDRSVHVEDQFEVDGDAIALAIGGRLLHHGATRTGMRHVRNHKVLADRAAADLWHQTGVYGLSDMELKQFRATLNF